MEMFYLFSYLFIHLNLAQRMTLVRFDSGTIYFSLLSSLCIVADGRQKTNILIAKFQVY